MAVEKLMESLWAVRIVHLTDSPMETGWTQEKVLTDLSVNWWLHSMLLGPSPVRIIEDFVMREVI